MTGPRGAMAVVLVVLCAGGGCASRQPRWPAEALQFTHHVAGDAPRAAPRLTFATYNVAGSMRPDALRRDLRQLDFVSAWSFQEVAVDGDADHASLARSMPPGLWHWAVVPVNERTDDGRAREGQAIASRWPIRAVQVWPLPTDGAKRRVAVAATLDAPGGPILFVNTDHELSFFDVSAGNRRQVAQLVRRITAAGVDRVVVAGDFNTAGNLWRLQGSDADVRRVARELAAAGVAPLPDRSPHDATFGDAFGVRQLDHLFVRRLRVTRWATAADAKGSDHLPVWCEVEDE